MKWIILPLPTFLKDLADLPRRIREEVEEFAFEILPNTDNPYALPQIEKLKGYRDYYKARFGSYRVGLRIIKQSREIKLYRVRHRRDIYRHFP
jgi:mRNA interferase RelE/StbE